MISFTSEYPGFSIKNKVSRKRWLKGVALLEGFRVGELTYIFVTDEALLAMNQEYLQHDTYTDIITFDNSDTHKLIEGDIFISVDRLRENATKYNVSFEAELSRVLSHGLLHLCGYKDKTASEAKKMRAMENASIALWDEFLAKN